MPKFWTERGIIQLGKVVKAARDLKSWSLRDLEEQIKLVTPNHPNAHPTYSTIDNLEKGKGKFHPKWNTLVALANVGFVLHPRTGKPFTEGQLSDIAAEYLDPETGWYSLPLWEIKTISKLIQIELLNCSWWGIEQFIEDTQIPLTRLEQLIDGQKPTAVEIYDLAQGLHKMEAQMWSESDLLKIVVAEFES